MNVRCVREISPMAFVAWNTLLIQSLLLETNHHRTIIQKETNSSINDEKDEKKGGIHFNNIVTGFNIYVRRYFFTKLTNVLNVAKYILKVPKLVLCMV